MFKKLLTFLKKIFGNRDTMLLEAEVKTKNDDDNDVENFRKEIKFNNSKEIKELIKDILQEGNNILTTQEETNEIQEKLVEYIDVLIKKIDKCQTDIAIKQVELRKVNS